MHNRMLFLTGSYLLKKPAKPRHHLTDAREKLWEYLRIKPLGYSFSKKYPFDRYVADFFCQRLKLVIEVVDDEPKKIHPHLKLAMKKDNLKLLRFSNHEIVHSPVIVISAIERLLLENLE